MLTLKIHFTLSYIPETFTSTVVTIFHYRARYLISELLYGGIRPAYLKENTILFNKIIIIEAITEEELPCFRSKYLQ